MTCLFIGGIADGRRINVPDGILSYRIPHIGQSLASTLYRPQRLRGGSKEIVVYIEERLTLDGAITQLIERYPEPESVRVGQ